MDIKFTSIVLIIFGLLVAKMSFHSLSEDNIKNLDYIEEATDSMIN